MSGQVDAYRASFDFFVLAADMGDASDQIKAWRQLAVACGFEPGSGTVKKATDGEISRMPDLLAVLRAARDSQLASERTRDKATRAVAAHLDGDFEKAETVVNAINPLTTEIAEALAGIPAPEKTA